MNKPLLLASQYNFVEVLLDGLLLTPDHPRNSLADTFRFWLQKNSVQCFAQLALHTPSREVLLQNPAVTKSLEEVATCGMTAEIQSDANAALLALSDTKSGSMKVKSEENPPKHVMLSYQWDAQPCVQRINDNLLARGYRVWFDL